MIRECGAQARRNNHKHCRRFAMINGKCHLHGGMVPKHNPGPKTEEGKLRQKMASWKHGMRSKEAMEEKKYIRELIKQSKSMLWKKIRDDTIGMVKLSKKQIGGTP